jgi:CYTH domain-containing protein
MSVVRRFLVAPALVRLLRKERRGSRITEGYFPPQAGRTSYVRVDGQQCHLILVETGADGTAKEERTDVPRAHGDALMDVCSGKAVYDRTVVTLGGGREAQVDRYTAPGSLDLISVGFANDGEAQGFVPPAWFGSEVTSDAAYERHAMALQGPPQSGEVGLSNAALEAVLDLIEPRFGFGRFGAAQKPAEEDGVVNALRRIAVPSAAPAVAVAPEPISIPEPAPLQAEEIPAESSPPAETSEGEAQGETQGDARIDDVIESLSQALGTAIRQPQEPARDEEEGAGGFERWTVRPRRTQQT